MSKKSKCPLEPLDDRVIVFKIAADTMTEGGLHLPEVAVEKSSRAIVQAVGPGKLSQVGTRSDMQVKVGDYVFYDKFAGTVIKLKGVEYLVLSENEIFAVGG